MWVSTDEGGLNKFNPSTKMFTLYKYNPNDVNSISSDLISSLLEDRNGNIWIGTDGEVFVGMTKNQIGLFVIKPIRTILTV